MPQCTGHPTLSCFVKSLVRNGRWLIVGTYPPTCVPAQSVNYMEGAATVATAVMSFPFPAKVTSDRAAGARAAQTLLIRVACFLSLNHMMVTAVRLSMSLSSEEPALPRRTPQNCRLRTSPPAACGQDPPGASSTRLLPQLWPCDGIQDPYQACAACSRVSSSALLSP